MSAYFCNPIDLPYRFQDVTGPDGARTVHREGADPSVVLHQGVYFMFVSMSRGFFSSVDLVEWEYHRSDVLPMFDYAPDVRVIDGALVVTASKMAGICPFYRSPDPRTTDFVEVSAGTFAFFDPNLFQDDDGRVYLYWGCSPLDPLYGVEVDRETFAPLGDRVELLGADLEAHGWEHPGEDHIPQPLPEPRSEEERAILELIGGRPFIEGAWMTKHDGVYHLQYAAPMTEANTYADGVYTATSPLGPFVYSPHSPYSAKPGGFVTGAGHGSTFQDGDGAWWHAATMRVSVHHPFERRVGIFPAAFDEAGVLHCDQVLGDYPIPVDRRGDDGARPTLLSAGATATASSWADDHPPSLAVDEDIRTWWAASEPGIAAWLQLDLGSTAALHSVQVNLADHEVAGVVPPRTDGADIGGGTIRAIDPELRPVEYRLEVSGDGESWSLLPDGHVNADAPHRLIVARSGQRARFVRLSILSMAYGATPAISGLRVFGTIAGETPTLSDAEAVRLDPLTGIVRWTASEHATGAVVRYGIGPDALYRSHQVAGVEELVLRGLNAGCDYWVAVDLHSPAGTTRGSTLRMEERPSVDSV